MAWISVFLSLSLSLSLCLSVCLSVCLSLSRLISDTYILFFKPFKPPLFYWSWSMKTVRAIHRTWPSISIDQIVTQWNQWLACFWCCWHWPVSQVLLAVTLLPNSSRRELLMATVRNKSRRVYLLILSIELSHKLAILAVTGLLAYSSSRLNEQKWAGLIIH